ncbi:E3 ubiquitin-protein ligase rnf146-like [Onthophagus taurus]|uniref:E3 ubiquitin-protein ligase rnf146-like n=1 Tax=Onthophagus taurus TaxID=166361 RepID=UPI0039BDF8AF
MAEASSSTTVENTKEVLENKEKGDGLECAVCLQICVHPAQLPCGHIFCFLCIKGIANQSKKCAMCRQEIPRDFIEHPTLVNDEPIVDATENFDGNYQWFYEGRNGWWQYDERTSKELESCYKSGERICELLIAGFLYVADMESMLQIRRNDPSRRRRIKRDLASIRKKGVAGLRTESDLTPSTTSDPEITYNTEVTRPHSPTEGRTDGLTPTTPSNTPQSPTSGRESPQNDDLEVTIDRIQNLRLNADERLHQRHFNRPRRSNEHSN